MTDWTPSEDTIRAMDPGGLERQAAEIARLQQVVDFVALWCYRKCSAGDHERLGVITHHPSIKVAAKALGFIDGEQR